MKATIHNPIVLRKTKSFTAVTSAKGVRITASGWVTPKSRVVRFKQDWENYLKGLSDSTFEAACVIDFGIGVFQRKR